MGRPRDPRRRRWLLPRTQRSESFAAWEAAGRRPARRERAFIAGTKLALRRVMILQLRRPASTGLLAAIALGLCLACRRTPAPNAAPVSAAGFAPIVIKFADQGNEGIFAYAKRERLLERELAKVNATIEWVPAAGAFSASFDAMNSGALNASGGAISPIVGALSHNLPFRIYAIAN